MSKLWEAISSPANFPNYDARTGLGYGAKTGFHAQRSYQSSFPYRDADPNHEEVEGDEEDDEELIWDPEAEIANRDFHNKIGVTPYRDPYSTRKTDPYYYYGSATPTGMFGESVGKNRTKGSISPIPNLYKKKQAVSGGVYGGSSIRVYKPILHTLGTKRGWSAAPKEIEPVEPENLEDDNEAVEKIRELVRFYHTSNLYK